jgi:molybdenum cofactor cytidylyltransferase
LLLIAPATPKAFIVSAIIRIAAILLAAGRSRRMGEFKPLLSIRSSTIIETCLDTIEAADVEQTVVVVGHRADEVRARLASRNVTFAVNPDPDSGMGASIALGVQALDDAITAAFIALVDQPAIPASIYQLLLRERAETGARIVLPEFEGHRGHPVLVDLSFRNELLKLDEGEGLRGFLDQHASEVHRIRVDCPYVIRDLDTPEDYRQMLAEAPKA